MTAPLRPRSPLWLVVLSLVSEEPMHPYRMQALIKERGKDQIANVSQRNSVYQTIAALLRAGLIAVRGTSRDEHRPERTVYEVTEQGRRMWQSWMREVLANPAREFSDFPAALSLVAGLEPDEVGGLLQQRITALERRRAELEQPVPGLPRLFLLESEYMAAVARAQIQWLRAISSDLKTGRLTWNERWLRQFASQRPPEAGDPARTRRSPSRRGRVGSAGRRQEGERPRTPRRKSR
jgi:DNA-binding PadR family transcriptional regulator